MAGDGGIVWDIDGQGLAYHNDIFGISRDDLSCFEQIKSKSENTDALVIFDNNGSFSTDDSWLISGNDNAPIEATGNLEKPAGIESRLNREWRVQETGTVGTIKLSYDLSTITGPSGIGTNNLNQTRLMVDDDGNFANGGTTLISPSAVDGTNDIVTFDVDFMDGQYYSLGSIEIAALPITLISFEVENYKEKQVEVKWVSAAEVNNQFYTIESSIDGIKFKTVANVDGAGISNDIISYSYIDKTPLVGLSYYRLKQTDTDGEFSYSSIQSIFTKSVENLKLTLMPNPISNGQEVKLKIDFPEGVNKALMSVFNSQGKILFQEHLSLENGFHFYNPSGLSPGVYFIRIQVNNRKAITKRLLVR